MRVMSIRLSLVACLACVAFGLARGDSGYVPEHQERQIVKREDDATTEAPTTEAPPDTTVDPAATTDAGTSDAGTTVENTDTTAPGGSDTTPATTPQGTDTTPGGSTGQDTAPTTAVPDSSGTPETTVETTVEMTTEQATTTSGRPTTSRPPTGKPEFPKCRDTENPRYCLAQIQKRDKIYCRQNIRFGRFQCCRTCVKEFGGNPDDAGDFAMFMLGRPIGGCKDQVTSGGTSLTPWCKKHVDKKPWSLTAPNCYVPAYQLKCLKTCGVCDRPPVMPIKKPIRKP